MFLKEDGKTPFGIVTFNINITINNFPQRYNHVVWFVFWIKQQ